MSELSLIERISAAVAVRPGVAVGIGDDAAVLAGSPPIVATQDLLVEGVHFRRATTGLDDLGHKALAVNLSDLAAMGAEPVAVLVGLGLPADDPLAEDEIGLLYAGMERLAARAGVTVAGGDVTAAPALVLAVTALGRMAEGRSPVLRSGGRAGDLLCVTGTLGAAEAGRRALEEPALAEGIADVAALHDAHRRPMPRLAEGLRLAAAGAHAMMDVSDGAALDADRLARASGLTAVIELERLPMHPAAVALARAAGLDPPLMAATGGEDYELLVALGPEVAAGLADALDSGLTAIGRLEAGPPGVRLRRGGEEIAPASLGWEHRV